MSLITTDMSFRILLLLAAVLRTSTGTHYLPCEYEYLHKCDLGFMTGFVYHPNDPNMTSAYCDVFQTYVYCVGPSVHCKGEFIDAVRYMTLRHMIVDKTLGLCPHYNLEPLKTIVQADEKYRLRIEHLSGVGKDDIAPCTANIHVKCATQGQQDFEKGVPLCPTVKNYIQCYKNPENPCTAQIYTDYINLVKKCQSHALEMYHESPRVTPGC